MDMVDKY